jgi:hypothetical protein
VSAPGYNQDITGQAVSAPGYNQDITGQVTRQVK